MFNNLLMSNVTKKKFKTIRESADHGKIVIKKPEIWPVWLFDEEIGRSEKWKNNRKKMVYEDVNFKVALLLYLIDNSNRNYNNFDTCKFIKYF